MPRTATGIRYHALILLLAAAAAPSGPALATPDTTLTAEDAAMLQPACGEDAHGRAPLVSYGPDESLDADLTKVHRLGGRRAGVGAGVGDARAAESFSGMEVQTVTRSRSQGLHFRGCHETLRHDFRYHTGNSVLQRQEKPGDGATLEIPGRQQDRTAALSLARPLTGSLAAAVRLSHVLRTTSIDTTDYGVIGSRDHGTVRAYRSEGVLSLALDKVQLSVSGGQRVSASDHVAAMDIPAYTAAHWEQLTDPLGTFRGSFRHELTSRLSSGLRNRWHLELAQVRTSGLWSVMMAVLYRSASHRTPADASADTISQLGFAGRVGYEAQVRPELEVRYSQGRADAETAAGDTRNITVRHFALTLAAGMPL